ncbi:desulfoferrodoxin [Candidatus Pacearchaeota archaeon]|nr:MAG: desulfoferrodoxin [Candidatus Pacearchaeota archaeon]
MTKRNEVYKCEKCGNIVEVLDGSEGTLACCGEPMKLLEEQTADKTLEKHVPIVEKIEGGIRVTVGSTLHPMTEEHYIEWIEVIANGFSFKKFLSPGNDPIAEFEISAPLESLTVREHCNLHGLWKSGAS